MLPCPPLINYKSGALGTARAVGSRSQKPEGRLEGRPASMKEYVQVPTADLQEPYGPSPPGEAAALLCLGRSTEFLFLAV